MGIFRFSRGLIDRIAGAEQRSRLKKKKGTMVDPLQKYTTVGEYHVDAQEGTPDGRSFILTVYKDNKGVLHQALSPATSPKLAPEYTRLFNDELGRFRAFRNVKTGRRYEVEKYLEDFAQNVKKHTRQGTDSINLGIITDTHFKDKNSMTFYGWNGLSHVREFSYLDELGLLDLKAHLGDWIDGSDAGLVDESELIKLRDAFKSDKVPYLMIKGNHDENDKFDEHHDLEASFPEHEFENIMFPSMYGQSRIHYISRQHGVAYFDLDGLRVISVNTSDVPYVLNKKGQKRYDTKITLAIREDQMEEII